jgi:hypothetical protein
MTIRFNSTKLTNRVQSIHTTRGNSTCKIVECKGRHANYSESREDIERHFSKRCRAADDPYGWNVKDTYDSVHAIYTTSGKLAPDAKAFAAATAKSHGIPCSVMVRKDVLRLLKEASQPRLVEIVEKYY